MVQTSFAPQKIKAESSIMTFQNMFSSMADFHEVVIDAALQRD